MLPINLFSSYLVYRQVARVREPRALGPIYTYRTLTGVKLNNN